MNPLEQIQEAQHALAPIFSSVDARIKHNLRKVLQAFRSQKVGVHHFSSVTGYGHNDLGRETFDRVLAEVMGAERAIARVQLVSGTHAIACALFGVLRPGDELLSVAGAPYDTLEEVIGLRGEGSGSLIEYGIEYRQLELTPHGEIDWEALAQGVKPQTRMVLIQRSCGYSWRSSLSISDIAKIVEKVKAQNPDTVCFVDNCYGEFVEEQEPTQVGQI